MQLINEHNANNNGFELKMNQFGDLVSIRYKIERIFPQKTYFNSIHFQSHDEYKKLKTEVIGMSKIQVHLRYNGKKNDRFLEQVDLRKDGGYVTEVKDQKEGPVPKSSLAFSAVSQ